MIPLRNVAVKLQRGDALKLGGSGLSNVYVNVLRCLDWPAEQCVARTRGIEEAQLNDCIPITAF